MQLQPLINIVLLSHLCISAIKGRGAQMAQNSLVVIVKTLFYLISPAAWAASLLTVADPIKNNICYRNSCVMQCN